MPQFQPILFQSGFLKSVDLGFWKIEEDIPDLISLLPDASCTSKAPYVQYKSVKRRKEWLSVRVLLAKMLGADAAIHYLESGKPYLAGGGRAISISHTNGLAAIAVSVQPVGIDIEQVGARAYHLRNYFLQDDEYDFSEIENPELFATFLWSAKESVYKLYDLPGLELKAGIRTSVFRREPNSLILEARVEGSSQLSQVYCCLMEDAVFTCARYVGDDSEDLLY